jgi:hypothetical protein
MEDEERWVRKIREILRRAGIYATARVRLMGPSKESAWVCKRWQMERRSRLRELIRLAGL